MSKRRESLMMRGRTESMSDLEDDVFLPDHHLQHHRKGSVYEYRIYNKGTKIINKSCGMFPRTGYSTQNKCTKITKNHADFFPNWLNMCMFKGL